MKDSVGRRNRARWFVVGSFVCVAGIIAVIFVDWWDEPEKAAVGRVRSASKAPGAKPSTQTKRYEDPPGSNANSFAKIARAAIIDTVRNARVADKHEEAPASRPGDAGTFDREAPENEALDWESMNEAQRAKIGLTRFALHASKNAANWGFAAHILRRMGHEQLAKAAWELDMDMLAETVPGVDVDTKQTLERERAMLDRIKALDTAGDDSDSNELARLLGQAEENLRREEAGEGDPVGDKIASERESALNGENGRGKNEEDEEK